MKDIKDIWNKSLYKIDGKEVELFKDVDFIEQKFSKNEVYINNNQSIIPNIDLLFLKQYKVHQTNEIVVYKIPFTINFELEIDKLRNYFKQIGIGKFNDSYGKVSEFYLLKLYLFKNLSYRLR